MTQRRLDPRKLLLSKWTAAQPRDRERHFLVIQLIRDERDDLLAVELQAVVSGRSQRLNWHELKDAQRWLQGWR
ncbi:TIGR02450 family Trp-rich protein [Pseudomonas sp. SP16.1]|uniref:TIGR02450 family Trp-rich protein n=1 Tax=Pseudomonas sp. SP16.1 TaxID=3458854 RepID=UPI0040467434